MCPAGPHRWIDGTPLRYPLGPVLEDWGYAPPNCGYFDPWLNSNRGGRLINADVRAGSCDNANAFVCETSKSCLWFDGSGQLSQQIITGYAMFRIRMRAHILLDWSIPAETRCIYLLITHHAFQMRFLTAGTMVDDSLTGIYTGRDGTS